MSRNKHKAPQVLAVVSRKGGAGKTTVTMQLAGALARQGEEVLVLDLDPQQSALRWAMLAPDGLAFPARVERVEENASLDEVLAASAGRAVRVLLDCPPSLEHPLTHAALMSADLAIVPVVPSPTDLWSSRATEQFIQHVMKSAPRLRACLLPNRIQRTSLAADVLELLREFNLPVLEAALVQRNAYAQSAACGASVFQLGRTARAAQEEVLRTLAAMDAQFGGQDHGRVSAKKVSRKISG